MNAKRSKKTSNSFAQEFDKWERERPTNNEIWHAVEGVFESKELLQKQFIKRLLSEVEGQKQKSDEAVELSIPLGLLPADSHWELALDADHWVIESLLIKLKASNFILQYDINIQDYFLEDEDQLIKALSHEEVLIAHIKCRPRELKPGLELFLSALERIMETRQKLVDPSIILYIFQDKDGEIVFVYKGKKYKMKRPRAASENDNFIVYMLTHPGRPITHLELEEKAIKGNLKKSVHQILNDLGFKKELRNLFFPRVSKEEVRFENKFNAEDLRARKFDWQKIENLLGELDSKRITRKK